VVIGVKARLSRRAFTDARKGRLYILACGAVSAFGKMWGIH